MNGLRTCFEKDFQNADKCGDTYSMPRENEFGLAQEETEMVGKSEDPRRPEGEVRVQLADAAVRMPGGGCAFDTGMPSCTGLCIRRIKGV